MKFLLKHSGTINGYTVFVLFFIFSFYSYGFAIEQNLTLDDIINGLSKAEDFFANSDLRLDFVKQNKQYTKEDGSRVISRSECSYARKFPGPLYRWEQKVYEINVDTNNITVVSDNSASYDGNATCILRRPDNRINKNAVLEGKPGHGTIKADFEPNLFPRAIPSKFRDMPFIEISIWSFGSKPLSSIIRKNKDVFHIEGTDILEGAPVIILVGGPIMNEGFGPFTLKYWISPQRGFLPLKMQYFRSDTGLMLSENVLSDLIQLPNGFWFAKYICGAAKGTECAYQYRITNISVEPIPDGYFTAEFPEGTKVIDEILGVRYEK
jgi:hypothetical protein